MKTEKQSSSSRQHKRITRSSGRCGEIQIYQQNQHQAMSLGGYGYPYGFDKWFKLFNPRQLLTLVKLVKLIREAGKKIEEEKLKEGWSKEEEYRYAEAVTRYADYNCMTTFWNYGGRLPAQVAYALSMRSIAISWNWGDDSPFAEMSSTGALKMNLDKITKKLLPYLVSAVSGSSSNLLGLISGTNGTDKRTIDVVRGDALILSKLDEERFDLIVTDPHTMTMFLMRSLVTSIMCGLREP